MYFNGYQRPDGKVGIRNHVLILPASVCASDTTRIIASQINGAVTFNNQNGCSQVEIDQQLTMDIMAGFAANPNVYGTVVVSLGCENCQMDLVVGAIRKRTNKPLETFIIQETGGTLKTIEVAVRAGKAMVEEASKLQRQEFNVSKLIIATECGGSDPTSGLSANKLIGEISDRIVDMGGTSILSETTELIGAEHILAARAKSPEIAERIYEIIYRFEEHVRSAGHEEIRESNPTPGNIEGGITTLEEKSLGCIHKGGHRQISAVYDYAKPINEKGLVIMDTEGHDPSSVAAMVAGGAQIVVFSTGQGTPTGNVLAPVIKITGNKYTYEKMKDNMDIDASGLMYGTESLKNLGDNLFNEIIQVCNGKLTKAEALGYTELSIARLCNFT